MSDEPANRELDLELLFPEARKLRARTEHGEWVSFEIEGDLEIEQMVALLRAETRVNNAIADEDHDALAAALEAGQELVESIIRATHPDAPPLRFGLNSLLTTLAWLAADVSVADAITNAISAGSPGAKTRDEAAAGSGENEPAGEGADATPLPSSEPSPTRSSGSGGPTGGDRSGGAEPGSEPSALTSEQLTPV